MQQNPSSDHFSVLPPNPYLNFSDHSFTNNNNMIDNVTASSFHFTSWQSIQPPAMNGGVLSNNSTSDEEQSASLVSERKQRRMISNRESARRSRIRKQRHLDELWSHVLFLRGENHHLVDRLNRAAERHETVVLENSQLKEEAFELRKMLTDLRTQTVMPFGFNDDVITPCNAAYLRAGSSNITASMDLLG